MAAILNLAAILDSGIAMTPHAHVLDLHKIVAFITIVVAFHLI